MEYITNLHNSFMMKTLDFLGLGAQESTVYVISLVLSVLLVLGIAWVANFLVKGFILGLVRSLVKKSNTQIGQHLLDEKFFHRISHVVPAFVISALSKVVLISYELVPGIVEIVVNLYLVVIALWSVDALLNAIYKAWEESKLSSKLPLKGICQAIKLLFNATGVIFILSILLNKSPLYFFSGLGALTAVLLLVFKDVILGLVAGIQLTANNIVRKGDWVEMPKYGADGDVIDVSLTTVKVQNWDKTITTLPAHALVSDAFKNWRGMSESGGRRIKRSISIDLSSVRFLKKSEVEDLEKINLIEGYLKSKKQEIGEGGLKVDEHGMAAPLLNGRNLTNIGTFRAYCKEYLRSHASIHKEGMTFLVRQLAPSEKGVPIEIYVFVNDVRWIEYEAIQSDIFDHLLATLPIFGLRAFQLPSDSSLVQFGQKAS